jgi:hypothetical protein
MPKTSLWAVPRDPAPFARWIERLATRTGAPVFPPHVTVNEESPPTAAFTVDLVALADSDERFRCITISAAPTPALAAVERPHLSLLYAELPAEERAALRASVDLPLPMTIEIAELWRVETSGAVANWQITQRLPLVP